MNVRRRAFALGLLLAAVLGAGCSAHTYKADKLKEAVISICEKEYGVENVDVKIVGTTIGVYLPLPKLFSTDFKNALLSGKIKDIQALMDPDPEAIEKVEDVLFTLSRVLLSTDRKIAFYTVQAVDTEKTGMSMVLTGYVDDIRRVRLWDISRDEYRRRIVHELRPNRTARFHQPVRQFFEDLNTLPIDEVRRSYFGENLPLDQLRQLFFYQVQEPGASAKPLWELSEMRSVPIQKNQVLVYVKARPSGGERKPGYPAELKYLFLLGISDDKVTILRIIPYQYLDAQGETQQVPFPKELGIERNLENWEEEFSVKALELGPFLADQISRRVQALISQDERMANTFRDLKFELLFKPGEAGNLFDLTVNASLVEGNNYSSGSMILHEDMLYFLDLLLKEMGKVLHSYRFENFEALRVKLAQETSEWMISRQDLEGFRKNKITLKDLFVLSA